MPTNSQPVSTASISNERLSPCHSICTKPSNVGAKNGSRKFPSNCIKHFSASTTSEITLVLIFFAPSPSQLEESEESSSIRLRKCDGKDADRSSVIMPKRPEKEVLSIQHGRVHVGLTLDFSGLVNITAPRRIGQNATHDHVILKKLSRISLLRQQTLFPLRLTSGGKCCFLNGLLTTSKKARLGIPLIYRLPAGLLVSSLDK